MPPGRYEVHLATALDIETVRAPEGRIRQKSKPYSYVGQSR
jgi:hypothetical protein